MRSTRRLSRILLLALFLFTFWVQFPSYADAFLRDDFKHLEFMQVFASTPWRIYRVFSPYWIGWYYRPLQHVLIFVNRLLFGTSPPGYYLVSLGLHCVNLALLYRLARRLRLTRPASLLVVALVSVHWLDYDALGWISSSSVLVAATFSLLSLLAMVSYVDTDRLWYLWAALFAFCGALLAREESMGLLLVVVAIGLWNWRARQRPVQKAEWLALSVLLTGLAAYFYFQLSRSTWVTSLDPQMAEQWWQATRGGVPFQFLFQAASLLVVPSLRPSWPAPFWQQITGLFLTIVVLLWWLKGSWRTRVVLLWALATLAILYVLVPLVAKPSLAARYLYVPWLGLSLAIGASFGRLRRRSPRPAVVTFVAAGCCVLFLSYQTTQVRIAHHNNYRYTRRILEMRDQLLNMIQDPSPDAHFFAYHSPSTPDYVQAMAAVWYGQRFRQPGGDVNRLLDYGRASNHFYVLNYEQGQLYNLMPELQQAEQTIFAWDRRPLAKMRWDTGQTAPLPEAMYHAGVAAGPAGERRFALQLSAPNDGWASLAYERVVPEGSELRFAFMLNGDAGATGAAEAPTKLRLRLQREGEQPVTLFEATRSGASPDQGWESVTLAVSRYWGDEVTLFWEAEALGEGAASTVFWANPRFVLEPQE